MSWVRLGSVLIAALLALVGGSALLASAILVFGLVGVALAQRRLRLSPGSPANNTDLERGYDE